MSEAKDFFSAEAYSHAGFGGTNRRVTTARWPRRSGASTKEHIVQPKEITLESAGTDLRHVSLCNRVVPLVPTVHVETRVLPQRSTETWAFLEEHVVCRVCLEQWVLEDVRKLQARIFQAWGGFEPSSRIAFSHPVV